MCDAPIWQPICKICGKYCNEHTKFVWGNVDDQFRTPKEGGWEAICLACWESITPEIVQKKDQIKYRWERYSIHYNSYSQTDSIWLLEGKNMPFGVYMKRKYGDIKHCKGMERYI